MGQQIQTLETKIHAQNNLKALRIKDTIHDESGKPKLRFIHPGEIQL